MVMVGVIVGGDCVGDEMGVEGMAGVAVGIAVGRSSVGDRLVGVGVPNGPHATIARKSIEIINPRMFLVFINHFRSGRRGSRLLHRQYKTGQVTLACNQCQWQEDSCIPSTLL